MMLTPQSRAFTPLIVIMLLLLALPSHAGNQSATQQDAATKLSEGANLSHTFEQEHAAIIARVGQGDLPEEIAVKANELKIGLEKYLIETNAQLKILEIDVRHTSGEKQDAALSSMMDLTAERERTKMDYLRRLHALIKDNGPDGESTEPPTLPQKTETGTKKTKEEHSGTKWRTETLDIEIEIAPEDISTGEHD